MRDALRNPGQSRVTGGIKQSQQRSWGERGRASEGRTGRLRRTERKGRGTWKAADTEGGENVNVCWAS